MKLEKWNRLLEREEKGFLQWKRKWKCCKQRRKSHNEKSQVKFRSYQPENITVKEKQIERIEAPDITKHIQVHLQKEKEPLDDDIDLYKLAPKKLDFVLKRNIERKLVKLDKRTLKAICEMVRDKLQQSAKKNNSIYTR